MCSCACQLPAACFARQDVFSQAAALVLVNIMLPQCLFVVSLNLEVSKAIGAVCERSGWGLKAMSFESGICVERGQVSDAGE